MKLSVIIPTLGIRRQIPLHNLISNLSRQDIHEILVVEGNGQTLEYLNGYNSKVRHFYVNYDRNGVFSLGNKERNAGILLATGTHLAFLDDDDSVEPNYCKTIYEKADNPALNLFRINHEFTGTIWKERVIRLMNVSTQMVVVPRAGIGLWNANIYESDLPFIEECSHLCKVTEWHEEIIATHNGGVRCSVPATGMTIR